MKKTTKTKVATPLYKVLADGESCSGGSLVWSLPTDDGPGEWHAVDGDLVRCSNGLHLTTDPSWRWQSDAEAYVVEVDADGMIGDPSKDEEIVVRKARLMRRLTWAELAAFGITPEGIKYDSAPQIAKAKRRYPAVPPPPAKGTSPALALISTVWENRCGSTEHSWRRVNSAMHAALMLAIEGGLSFAAGDFGEISRTMRGGYWMGDAESFYSTAIEHDHLRACASFETWAGRKPFMWEGKRLHRGARLVWAGTHCTVTSFDDANGSLTACSYKSREQGSAIDRRFKITNDALKRAEQDRKVEILVRSAAKEAQEALDRCNVRADIETIVAWTPEQRAEAVEWAKVAKHDARKERVKPPAAPAHVALAKRRADAIAATSEIAEAQRTRKYLVESRDDYAKRLVECDAKIERLRAVEKGKAA